MGKPDRDMGHEVDNLGGFRPTGNRLTPTPVVREQYVEILIVAPARLSRPRPKKWYEKPTIQFGTGLF